MLYPSETVHAVRRVLALSVAQLALDIIMAVEGVQYMPPTGSTDSACGGEPRRGETLMSHQGFSQG